MSSSSCLGRAAVPVRRVWRGLSARLGRRRRTTYVPVHRGGHQSSDVGVLAAGLGRLRKEVRTCEYRDVHVMWEMLSSSARGGGGDTDDDGKGATPATRRKGAAPWTRLVSYCCGL